MYVVRMFIIRNVILNAQKHKYVLTILNTY